MSLRERQNELAKKLHEVKDIEIIEMLEEELSYFIHRNGKDVTDVLTDKEFQELNDLASEASKTDTINEDEFKTLLKKWRTNS